MNDFDRRHARPSRPLFLGVFLVAGCGGAAPPAAAPPDPPPEAPAAEAPPPIVPEGARSAAPAAPPRPPPAASTPTPAIDEPLLPLTRAIVTVRLPGVTSSLVAVHGRGPSDIWFLTDESDGKPSLMTIGTIVRYDGKRIVERHTPCSSYSYSGLVVGKDEVLVLGSNQYFRGVPSGFRASLSREGKWDCSGGGYMSGLTVSSGDQLWKLDCDGMQSSCTLRASRGPTVQLPSYDASFPARRDGAAGPITASVSALWMKSPSDGWMTSLDEDGRTWLRRYNGVTWLPRAALDEGLEVVDLWVDDEGTVWLAAQRGGGARPATVVLRFDGRALQSLPVPSSSVIWKVLGTGAKDVWFIGEGSKVYQWDGQRLRQGEAPFKVGDAWASRGGEVWLVGGERGPGLGVVAHTAPLGEAGEVR